MSHAVGVKVVVILIKKLNNVTEFVTLTRQNNTKAARASTLSGVRGQGLGVHSVCVVG